MLAGAMLVYAGVELAAVARNQRGERGVAVMLLTGAVCLAMGNVAVGVVAGEFNDTPMALWYVMTSYPVIKGDVL